MKSVLHRSFLIIAISLFKQFAYPFEEKPIQSVSRASISQAYIEHFLKPPAIDKIQFSRSRNFYTIPTSSGQKIPYRGFTGYEGALDGKCFFIKHLTNSIFDQGRINPGHETIFGATDRFYWQMPLGHELLVLVPVQVADGGGLSNPREWFCRAQREILESLQIFGLDALAGGATTWIEKNKFRTKHANNTELTCEITQIDPLLRPLKISGTYINPVPFQKYIDGFEADLTYNNQTNFYPNRIEYKIVHPSRGLLIYTNVVEFIQFKNIAPEQRLFKPSEFRIKPQKFVEIFVFSNQTEMIIEDSGKWALKPRKPIYSSPESSLAEVFRIGACGSVTISGFLSISFLVGRLQRRKTNQLNQKL